MEGRIRGSIWPIRLIENLDILVLVPITTQGKGLERRTSRISLNWQVMGQSASFSPHSPLSLTIHWKSQTIMSSINTTMRFPPPSQWHHLTQFAIPTALRNRYEKMWILGSGVFTSTIPTTADLNHTWELTDPHLVVQKLLGGGEIVGKEFLSHYTIRLGVKKCLPFTASAPSREVLRDVPSRATVWWLKELKGKFPLKPVKIVQGTCICLQDTSLVEDPLLPQLPTVWGMACGIAWAEPEFEIHYLFVHISSTSIPPTPIYSERILVTIPNEYLDPMRPIPWLQQPSLGQWWIGSTDHYLRPFFAWEERKRGEKKSRRSVRKESRERCTSK
jgi:hypothetical protein